MKTAGRLNLVTEVIMDRKETLDQYKEMLFGIPIPVEYFDIGDEEQIGGEPVKYRSGK